MPPGRLVVCATPIGNLGDISDRLRNTLSTADVIYAEDTRRTAKLTSHLGLSVPIISLFAGNEQSRIGSLVESVRSGDTVVLVSDAGMPTVSDPGASAVAAVREAGLSVSVVPGPSAVTSAVALAGFGGDRFVFEGFLPRKGRERAQRLADIASDSRAIVLFASPNRLAEDLVDLGDVCGPDRAVAVTRELTKVHEEVWLGTLGEAAAHWSDPVKGEVTVVLGPFVPDPPSLEAAVGTARTLVDGGMSVSEAARQAASSFGVSRREIYESLLRDQESS